MSVSDDTVKLTNQFLRIRVHILADGQSHTDQHIIRRKAHSSFGKFVSRMLLIKRGADVIYLFQLLFEINRALTNQL